MTKKKLLFMVIILSQNFEKAFFNLKFKNNFDIK